MLRSGHCSRPPSHVNQDGKLYIVSNVSRRVLNTSNPLSEGYTISSQSIFKNHEDHDFYDKECPAHKELKVLERYTGVSIESTY
jgi:hypothetical protein